MNEFDKAVGHLDVPLLHIRVHLYLESYLPIRQMGAKTFEFGDTRLPSRVKVIGANYGSADSLDDRVQVLLELALAGLVSCNQRP